MSKVEENYDGYNLLDCLVCNQCWESMGLRISRGNWFIFTKRHELAEVNYAPQRCIVCGVGSVGNGEAYVEMFCLEIADET